MKKLGIILLGLVLTVGVFGQVFLGTPNPVADVAMQDQTTDALIVKFNRIDGSTTLKYNVAIDDTTLVVVDETEADVGDYLIIFSPTLLKFSTFNIISIIQDTILVVDNLIDVPYGAGSYVDLTTANMAVDGSSTKQIFGIRGASPSPVGITMDVTQIVFTCITDDPVDLSKFMDIAGGITRGLQIRKRDGDYKNLLNIKTNQEFTSWTPYAETNPVQGQNGFKSTLKLAGQNEIGVVIRLAPGEDLECIVQDNLYDGSRILFGYALGHVVDY